jgi:hypothetical protein
VLQRRIGSTSNAIRRGSTMPLPPRCKIPPWIRCRLGPGEKSGVGIPDDGNHGEFLMSSDWKGRARLFVQRFWQPVSACMTCMPGSWSNILSALHWTVALRTGLFTALLAVLLTFTPASKLYAHRYGNALVVGCLTTLGDAYSHSSHYRIPALEHIATGIVSGLLALAASFLLEDRARRVRAAWARVFG